MTKARDWILRDDGALCLSGYPIRICMNPKGAGPFTLISESHGSALPYWALDSAKQEAERLADEVDAFTPQVEGTKP